MNETKPPRALTAEEQANMKGLDEFMGQPGRVVWYIGENGEWHPGWARRRGDDTEFPTAIAILEEDDRAAWRILAAFREHSGLPEYVQDKDHHMDIMRMREALADLGLTETVRHLGHKSL